MGITLKIFYEFKTLIKPIHKLLLTYGKNNE